MSQPFLGQLMLVSFNYAPRGFTLANGQVMAIQTNQALFAVLGTTFGGDGIRTFALPNLQGRVPIHQGNGFSMGEASGEESHKITANETPSHNHQVTAIGAANATDPSGAFLGGGGAQVFNTLSNPATMNANSIANTGGSQPHENRQPFLVMTWVIALSGIFPSQG
jgi:microcystin-dependent protein